VNQVYGKSLRQQSCQNIYVPYLDLFGARGAIWVTNGIWDTSLLFICLFVCIILLLLESIGCLDQLQLEEPKSKLYYL